MPDRPLLTLIVVDGFGCRSEREYNAIAQADTPRFAELWRDAAWTTLEASGLAVGLPEGQMGNSEVGHLNIGAGRVVDQDIVRISKSISGGELAANRSFVDSVIGKTVHLVGLLSDGGVHSLQQHLHGLIDASLVAGAAKVFVHAVLDGRDTPPKSAEKYLGDLMAHIDRRPSVQLATVIGRYFIMDRDRRWERVQRGYDLLTLGVGTETKDPLETLRRFYEQDVTDEFIPPISVVTAEGAHLGRVEDDHTLLFTNFRADRMRQIVTAFKDDTCEFTRAVHPRVGLVTMNRYHEQFDLPVLYPPPEVRHNLGEVLSRAGITQLRIAETEKYAHVTFFFNGGSDLQFPGEDRILVPSPKVATYDLKPEMSVFEVTDKVVEAIASRKYGVIIMNIANPDMVGHTGVMSAAVEAVNDTDVAIGRILDAMSAVDGVTLITADHGNAELMFDVETGQPHTAHTLYPVPFILVDPKKRFGTLRGGGALSNVAPTLLAILGLDKPAEMTAESLLVPDPEVVA